MLFNSYSFIFLFLPTVLLGFLFLEHRNRGLALSWLVIASLFFYAWWNPAYLLLLLLSISFNFIVGLFLQRQPNRWLLAAGIIANLGLLAYYKYAEFIVVSFNSFTGTDFAINAILLPLAISFFTFQQIAWLVDAHRGKATETNAINYCLFVSFFPQLIAGPIVHHKEVMPQFGQSRSSNTRRTDLEIGSTIFCIGFLKKVVLADSASIQANAVFDAAASGVSLTFLEAWGGALAYSFQLYFDFSGYSDMAIGLGRLFGIRLPVNFYSPYKATNIIEFWRRWHITLTRFLRDYLYIPLGGNRKGRIVTLTNVSITMLLGGLWHGAAWTFVLWGALHGIFLIINRLWKELRMAVGWDKSLGKWGAWISTGLTFTAVTFAWVLFRSEGFAAATRVYEGMLGMNGLTLPTVFQSWLGELASGLSFIGIEFGSQMYIFTWKEWFWLSLLAVIAFAAPNVQQLMSDERAGIMPNHLKLKASRVRWKPRPVWAVLLGILMAWALLALNRVDEFLYFQF